MKFQFHFTIDRIEAENLAEATQIGLDMMLDPRGQKVLHLRYQAYPEGTTYTKLNNEDLWTLYELSRYEIQERIRQACEMARGRFRIGDVVQLNEYDEELGTILRLNRLTATIITEAGKTVRQKYYLLKQHSPVPRDNVIPFKASA